MSFSDQTLLIVNSGSIKKRLIFQRLKKLGIKLMVLNKDKNWAQPYVDQWILADNFNHTESVQSIKDFLSQNSNFRMDGCLTFWEDDIPLAAKICEEFKLIGNSYEAAINTRDKYKMQEVFCKSGLPYIKQVFLKSENDLTVAMNEIGFPAVLKPVFGSDSQFVVYVSNQEEALEAYRYLLKNCTPDYDPIYKYNKKLFLYQEFIEGYEFSLESYVQHGIPHVIGIHEKTAMNLPFFMETGDYIPPRINEEQKQKLIKLTEAALIVLGLRNSLAHVEVKLSRYGLKIIEVASRMGGEYTYANVLQVYNFDMIKAGVEIALGINVTEQIQKRNTYIVSKFFIPKAAGLITSMRGFDEIKTKRYRNRVNYFLAKEVGDSVLIPPDGYENMGWITVKGSSYADAEAYLDDVLEEVEMEVAPFKSYSTLGKTKRRHRFAPALLDKKGAVRIEKISHLRRFTKKNLRNLRIGIACNIYEASDNPVEQDLMSVGKNIEQSLKERGYRITFFDFNDLAKAFSELRESDVDLVFNVCERINNSSLLEPHAAALLDMLQVPYTGSNPFTLGLCIDKIRVKKLLNYHNIPTPKWDYAYSLDDDIDRSLHYPLIVKPANTDNSIGITNESVVTSKKELNRQLERVIEELCCPALVEEYIEGDEYDVSILGSEDEDLQVLPLSRSIFKNMPKGYWHIFPYDAKWTENPVYKGIISQRPPKNISKKLQSLISEIALDTYRILHCHDYGRVEVRVDDEGNPFILELNPNPSINVNDCVPAVAELAGMDYGDFLEEIILMAIKRYKNRPPYFHLQTRFM